VDKILITRFREADVLKPDRVPKPELQPGFVVVLVQAFVNHAEIHMRKGELDEWNSISGLDCLSSAEACPSDDIAIGTKVLESWVE
jgi:NADPH:quinone reductase